MLAQDVGAEVLSTQAGVELGHACVGLAVCQQIECLGGGRGSDLFRQAHKLVVVLDQEPPVCGHRPSVDRLFRSVAQACGGNCTGILMTGMGSDGAEAIGEIKRAGGTTIAQDADSSIVYGMPKAAVQLGNIDRSVALQDIIPTAVEALHESMHRSAQPTGA